MLDPGLEKEVALITGANHGIGAATARVLAAQGAHVFVTYFRPPCPCTEDELATASKAGVGGPLLYWARQRQSADYLIQEILERGGTAAALEADLGNPDNIRVVFDRCEAVLGPVDILVNNHTHCAKDTFDPAAVKREGFAVNSFSAASADAHFAVNARSYA